MKGKIWNGKIYIFDNVSHLKYEREYTKGKLNGKGKEYFDNGELKYEGEYNNNYYRNWKIRLVYFFPHNNKGYADSELKYGWLDKYTRRNGKGREYYNNELIFDGEYLKGVKLKGKGKEYFNNDKLKFEGEYNNGKIWNGRGYNYKGYEEYEIKNGKGKIKEYDKKWRLTYEGE